MQVSESDASEILSEILFHDPKLKWYFYRNGRRYTYEEKDDGDAIFN
jgi:hypothetical protein